MSLKEYTLTTTITCELDETNLKDITYINNDISFKVSEVFKRRGIIVNNITTTKGDDDES